MLESFATLGAVKAYASLPKKAYIAIVHTSDGVKVVKIDPINGFSERLFSSVEPAFSRFLHDVEYAV